jgi:hypothetical protein
MTFEKAICFLPSSSYTFHRTPSNRTTAIPSYTHSQHYLSVVSLSISRSPRGAHVLANPNRHVRSFVGGSQLFRAFRYALCMLETPERLATRHHGPPSRCPLEHTKTTKKCRAPSGEPGSRCLDGTLRSFAQIMMAVSSQTSLLAGWEFCSWHREG